MILSHKHKFLFLKVPKAAGTSLEIALSKVCGPEDVLTPISKKDEETRRREGGRTAQNYRLPLRQYTWKDWWKLLTKREPKAFFNHISAEELMELLDPDIWDTYRTFAFVRNPWDQVASLYYWRNKKGAYGEFESFLQTEWIDRLEWRTRVICRPNDEWVLDDYLRFEELEEELHRFLRELGVKELPSVGHSKGGYRKDKGDYRELYDNTTRQMVVDRFGWLIEKFDYRF